MSFIKGKGLPIFIIGVLVIGLCAEILYLQAANSSQSPLPVTSVKEGYLECIEHEDEGMIAECLDTLSATVYGKYPTKDIAAVLDTLTYQQKNQWCHEIMHYMGWKAYAEEGDIATAFLNSSELCDSGMYHGVMEEFLRREGLTSNMDSLVTTVCTESLGNRPDVSEGLLSLCYHGLGHGLMYITSSDLQRSLDYCDLLSGISVNECSSGVFMEYNISKELGPLSNQRDLTDFSYCEGLKEKHKNNCYFRQGLNFLAAVGDVKKSMELCLQVPEPSQKLCFDGVGSNNPAPSKSHADAGIDCRGALEVSDTAYTSCMRGSLGFVLQLEWGDTAGALEFCNEAYDEYKDFCYREIGQAIQNWITPQETAEKKCGVLPTPEAQELCKHGVEGRM